MVGHLLVALFLPLGRSARTRIGIGGEREAYGQLIRDSRWCSCSRMTSTLVVVKQWLRASELALGGRFCQHRACLVPAPPG